MLGNVAITTGVGEDDLSMGEYCIQSLLFLKMINSKFVNTVLFLH